MTVIAGIGRPLIDAEPGVGNAQTVIAPTINHHIVPLGHMAVDALATAAVFGVAVMRRRIENIGAVALGANAVTLGPQSSGMGFVAVGADDAGMEHTALPEGARFEHFVLYLAIRVVFGRRQQGGNMGVEVGRIGLPGSNDRTPRMAAGAHRHLACIGGGRRPLNGNRSLGKSPETVIRQRCQQALILAIRAGLGPVDVARSRSVAGLATDADLPPGRLVAGRIGVVVFLEAGGMALRAAAVPVVVGPRPEQGVVMRDSVIGIQVKPALPAVL